MIQRRQWHWIDWALFIVLTAWSALGAVYIFTQPEELAVTSKTIFIAGLFLSLLTGLIFWRPNYVNQALFPVAMLLTCGTLQIYIVFVEQKPLTILYLPMLVIGFLSHRKYSWWTAPVFIAGFPVANLFLVQDGLKAWDFFNELLYGVLFYGLGLCLQRILKTQEKSENLLEENRRQYQLIHEQNHALEQYANQIEQLTLLEERNRVARELHDTVGHTFTSVIMGMDAVSYLIEVSPSKAKEKLDVLRSVTRKGLEEVRRSIHQMAPDGDDMLLSQQLARLANEFALHTGTQVRVQTAGEEFELPKQMKLTLIRCLQESLTNAKRHGRASTVEVTLAYKENEVKLRVEDDGIGTEHFRPGFGISAMQERIAALQGILEVETSPGQGTKVTCTIPARRLQAL
jgi:glucose-6-phosphate-specific signal transduction histidine kinase